MSPLLEQFLSEAREFLQGISEKLLQLETAPNDAALMGELFRLVHTLKGNSGLFDFPEMTRVLHAGEDLMDGVRGGVLAYTQALADQLLDAMDFVGRLCDEIESAQCIDAARAGESAQLAQALRTLIPHNDAFNAEGSATQAVPTLGPVGDDRVALLLAAIPEAIRIAAFRQARQGETLHCVSYRPLEDCFYQGDDPFHTARQTPDTLWGHIVQREASPLLAELDAYRCLLDFQTMSAAPLAELAEHYRYVPDQVQIAGITALQLIIPQGDPNGGPVYEDFVGDALHQLQAGELTALGQAAQSMLELSNPALWLSSALRWLLVLLEGPPTDHGVLRLLIESIRSLAAPDWTAVSAASAEETRPATPQRELVDENTVALLRIFAEQRQILMLDDQPAWLGGRLQAVAAVLTNGCQASGNAAALAQLELALAEALHLGGGMPLLAWLDGFEDRSPSPDAAMPGAVEPAPIVNLSAAAAVPAQQDDGARFGRRAEDTATGPKSLKVDQAKIDRLMNLIGEMVVSKNALPYLAQRAETQFGVRELSREIKAQYAVINRIAEEMQDAIMQVRMLPVSFVFQRFPRLVRDISRKLGKDVQLLLEGEDTEADKNIIESLADPLIHIVRNSLDHGLETPEVRLAHGKPAIGTLTIRARQEGDRVLIEIIDDGKGIDPEVVKRKALSNGLIDATTVARISDREAINLVFAAGFSTVEVISDLSGRGVGMDVVRSAVERVNGSIALESQIGHGTRIRISLPLSMAVTPVMIIESDGQLFGVPMDHVVETVRVASSAIRHIKHSQTTVLRGRIVPLQSLNTLLGLPAAPRRNADDELAVLVVRVGEEVLGVLVDNFRETVDVLQKPLSGVLAGLPAYSGSALMGDGSVLMVLNIREIV